MSPIWPATPHGPGSTHPNVPSRMAAVSALAHSYVRSDLAATERASTSAASASPNSRRLLPPPPSIVRVARQARRSPDADAGCALLTFALAVGCEHRDLQLSCGNPPTAAAPSRRQSDSFAIWPTPRDLRLAERTFLPARAPPTSLSSVATFSAAGKWLAGFPVITSRSTPARASSQLFFFFRLLGLGQKNPNTQTK